MASNLPYLKGVRTRYVNTLKKETDIAKDILACDTKLVDETELTLSINRCVERLQLYCDKVENQTDKLAEALGEKDEELTKHLIKENEVVCDSAMDCALNLKQFKEGFAITKAKETEAKDRVGLNQIVELQKKMNSIVDDQLKQQHELLKKQEKKERELATTVKLPKIDIVSFSGDKLKWAEFWDSFECAIHNNKKLSNIEKFNYLKGKVSGEAQRSIAGLSMSNENYQVAVDLLKDRFGDSQEVIDLHYSKMINLPLTSSSTGSLRNLLDNMERHLRSLEVLKQNVNQDVFVSMIRAKLPQEVLLQLEIMHGAKNKWTVDTLRVKLHEYITAREHAEKKDATTDARLPRNSPSNFEGKPRFGPGANRRSDQNDWGTQRRLNTIGKGAASEFVGAKQHTGSAEALVANTKQPSAPRYFDQCRYCDKRHWSDECPTYRTIEDRKKQLKDSCFKCLKKGHLSKDCKKNKSCVYCGEVNTHHRSLCPQKFQVKLFSAHLSEEITEFKEFKEEESCARENALVSSGEIVLMQTAQAKITNLNQSKSEQVRILLDSGSQRTYITERLAEQLQLRREKTEEIKVVTFGCETPKTVRTTQTKLSIQLNIGQHLDISANIVPFISGSVQRKALNVCSSENLVHLMRSLDMADSIPSQTESSTVEILIGSDYYLDIILSQKIEVQPGLYLLASKLGWILTGRTSEAESSLNGSSMLILTYGNNITETNVFTSVDTVTPMKPDLEDFWNIEAIGIHDDPRTRNDDIVKQHFKETLIFEDNRYQVTWPWREEIPDLPVNRDLAVGRLKSVVSRMRNKTDVRETYNSIIKDQLEKGVIEKVDNAVTKNMVHYLPHHAVINPLKPTTKLRIVYDASAKSRKDNKSLNECLYRGPVMLNDLCGLLMRFRLRTVAIVADIEKAFLQIGLQPSQRDVTRFLWLKDHHRMSVDSDNIQEYRFCRVPFGIITSPFLLGATVECHLDSYESELAEKLKSDIYVDNLITGTNSVNEAINLYHGAKPIFREASMNLREWITNNQTVNQFIAFSDRTSCELVKVLGHNWKVEQDTISLKEPKILVSETPTKRNVLKQVASVFDPMGLFSPVLLMGKIFIQSLWNKHLDWDDAISNDDISVWTPISSDLAKLPEHQINRCIALEENDGNVRYSLLCFCDASARAYAAAVYLFQKSSNSESRSDLLFCKTRLAPLKEMTIPRLELMAVVIGVRCLRFVKQQLNISIEGIHLWTDSQCVLKWIGSEKDLSVFVANRVKEIKGDGEIVFGYVKSRENPADIASRGNTFQNFSQDRLWWFGPPWLTDPDTEWPGTVKEFTEEVEVETRSKLEKTVSLQSSEALNMSEMSVTYYSGNCSPFGIKCENYSSLTKLVRVTTLVNRFINKLKKSNSIKGPLTSSELNEAENMWIVYIQRKNFCDIYEAIVSEKTNNLQKQLGVYIDDQGILRCKGRIDEARISESARRPVLLPKSERFTHLLIEKIHKESMHSGVSQCLSSVRYKFWIPHGRATVRLVIGKCLVCRRHEGGPYRMPSFAALPKTRVTEATPFSRTGLDYLGPMYVRTGKDQQKVWICLFTCLVTRAVHLELLRDMSTEEFLLGFRRFISERGCPAEIISDNSLTFKAANNALNLIWKNVTTCAEIQSYVSNKGIKWTFIVELAPWMGGFYERLVGLVKRALRKTLNRKLLDYVQLQTVLKEVEATVNSRPLVYVSDDIASTITLTPKHFLSLNPHTGIPELEYDTNDSDYRPYESTTERLLETWKKGQKLLNVFWKLWRDEYLLSLRERTKNALKARHNQSHFSPGVGDVVLVKEDIPRGCWRLGKVIRLVTSHDGCIRSAKLSLSSGRIIGRPLNLLFPIEVSEQSTEKSKNVERRQSFSPIKEEKSQRTKRAAAIKANMKIKKSLEE